MLLCADGDIGMDVIHSAWRLMFVYRYYGLFEMDSLECVFLSCAACSLFGFIALFFLFVCYLL